jgi:integrase
LGSIVTPRLYRKRCGIYFLRVILPAPTSSVGEACRKRQEVRCSLRTKHPARARAIAMWANARLAQASSMSERKNILDSITHGIRRWTDGELTVNGPDDQERWDNMLAKFPDVRAAFADRIRTGSASSADELARLMDERINQAVSAASTAGAAGPTPSNPTRLSDARLQYASRPVNLAPRTRKEQKRLLDALAGFLSSTYPVLGADPFVHDIATHHLTAFLDTVYAKSRTDGSMTDAAASPLTVLKKVSHLRTFFEWAREDREFTAADPTAGLSRRDKDLRKAAGKQERHYDAFSAAQLESIFEPSAYLAFNRAADYFWAPLLSLHLGTRLKEIVTLELSAIDRDGVTGLWFMDVKPEYAKNKNSIRRLPIAEKLLELGFIDYVERLRRLGASKLFPHLDFDSPTMQADPSKNGSRHFGNYLDSLDIRSPDLVFHSFRHTVVTFLQLHHTPLPDAMQITGHLAQDYAVRTGRVSEADARSVHVETYTHADKAQLGKVYPLQRLKGHLDRSIVFSLDYAQLKVAASIVTEHTVATATGFESGWHTARTAYTAEQVARLA